MANSISLADLRQRIPLSAGELDFLQSAGVRTADGAHNLLTASLPSTDADFPAMVVARRQAVVEALAPLLSHDYAQALVHDVGRPRGAAAPSFAALADAAQPQPTASIQAMLQGLPDVDLVKGRYANWPVLHEQGNRQACVAFAVTACLELLRAGQGTTFVPLSPQFLYWHMRTNPWQPPLPPGWNDGSTKLGYAQQVLATRGICRWNTCPYDTTLIPGHLEGAPPSNTAKAEAANNLVTEKFYQPQKAPGTARKVYDQLALGRPVAIAVPVYSQGNGSSVTNWSSGVASGQVINPYRNGVVFGGHAVCIVAFQQDTTESGGGWFIFRNSVGINWANEYRAAGAAPRVPDRSYGAISATYVEGYCWEALSLILP